MPLQTRAEDKYDLQLVNTTKEKRVQHQPWYKERLKSKYLKEAGGRMSHPHLLGTQWTFVKDGLDDFRDGYPPEPEDGGLIRLDSYHHVPKQQVKPHLSKHQMLYSKTLPGQERRQQNLESLLDGLQQHPLALYSHIEESVPPELFEDLIDALDPEMKLGAVDEEDFNEIHYMSAMEPEPHQDSEGPEPALADPGIKTEDSRFQSDPEDKDDSPKSQNKEVHASGNGKTSDLTKLPGFAKNDQETLENQRKRAELKKSIYTWPCIEKAKDFWSEVRPEDVKNPGYKWYPNENKSGTVAAPALTPAEDAHIKGVTKEFCDWVAELGGESNNIDESTVAGLFSGGYESKPALSVPIRVVELTNVPPELRMQSAATSAPGGGGGLSRASSAYTDKDGSATRLLQPGYVQTKPEKATRYGAWYLKPRDWKVLKPGQDLEDPKTSEEQFSEAKKKSVMLDHELAHMHGAREFIKFMREKGNTVPEFLSKVASMQREEELKSQMEQTARTETKLNLAK